MDYDKLLKLAGYFEKRAQEGMSGRLEYSDQGVRNIVAENADVNPSQVEIVGQLIKSKAPYHVADYYNVYITVPKKLTEMEENDVIAGLSSEFGTQYYRWFINQ